jgi:hydrogenase maturation protease
MPPHLNRTPAVVPAAVAPPAIAPVLVFGYGNPSRGDDGLAPMLLESIAGSDAGLPASGHVELLTDFQLQPEHALDLRGRERVLFVDASASCAEPYEFFPLAAAPDASVFTHALAPGAVLSVYERIEGAMAPPSWMLAIRGYAFELGEPVSAGAQRNLAAALDEVRDWLGK